VLARICLREMKDRVLKGKELSGWERDRYKFFKERGWSGENGRSREWRGELVSRIWKRRTRS